MSQATEKQRAVGEGNAIQSYSQIFTNTTKCGIFCFMNTPFRSFADVEANNHHILLPPDTTEAIVETLGSPKNVLTGNAELFAYTDYLGQALMHAALIELRGTSSENPPLVEQTRRLIQEKPSLREARDELEKTADGLLRSGWEINGKYENPRDVAVEGFNVGMALSGLAKNVTLLANHPTAYPNISTSTSRGGGKHTDRDMIHPVTAQEDRQEIGYALNTNPGKAIVLSTHSYVESMDKILKFTVPTT